MHLVYIKPRTPLIGAWLVLVSLPSNARGGPYALVSPEADLRGAFTSHGALPLTIDPVYSVAATTLDGESEGDLFGYDVSGAGDVNGDGFDDVVIGAPSYESARGRAYLTYGSAGGIVSTASTTLTEVETMGAGFGCSVSGAGDVNGDEYDDLIVGAPGAGADDHGNVDLFLGSAAGLETTAVATLDDTYHVDDFGWDVAAAGDVDGDGYDDIVVGASDFDGEYGAYVYSGSEDGVDAAPVTMNCGERWHDCGASVSGGGDLDGDGYDDVLVGAPAYDTSDPGDPGRVYVYSGSATGVSSEEGTTLTGEADDSGFGSSVSGAGDVNGDGYEDIIVGAPGYDDHGRVYVLYGSPDGVALSDASRVDGEMEESWFGWCVSEAGDVNGDGHGDVFVGADGYDEFTGRAYRHLGSPEGVSLSAASTMTGEAEGDWYAYGLSGAGDVNGNGLDDLIVGAHYHDASTGRAYVYLDAGDTDGGEDTGTADSGDTGETTPDGSDTGTGPLGDIGASKTGCGSGCAQTPGPIRPSWALALLAILGWRQRRAHGQRGLGLHPAGQPGAARAARPAVYPSSSSKSAASDNSSSSKGSTWSAAGLRASSTT